MNEKEYKELQNSLASARMEGYEVTKQTEQDCIRLLDGEITVEELVKEILIRPLKVRQDGI